MVDGSTISYAVLGPDGTQQGGGSLSFTGAAEMSGMAVVTGWHIIRLSGSLLPVLGSSYKLTITYTGQASDIVMEPQPLAKEQINRNPENMRTGRKFH